MKRFLTWRDCRRALSPKYASLCGVSCLLAMTLLLAGCGPENELGRLPFSGTVTLNGEPLKNGSISFTPTKEGEGATRSGATVVDGKFNVEAQRGLPPGEYLVRINASSGTPAPPEDQPPGESRILAKELIPPAYNSQSEKTITVEEGAENHFEFPIKT